VKISCLAVTNRPAFRPWLLWNYEKQTHADKELVIVEGFNDLVAARNEALGKATGHAVAWFDDDDWHHPLRLERLDYLLRWNNAGVAGNRRGVFLDLLTGWGCEVERTGGVFFNNAGVRYPWPLRFTEGPAEDVRWLQLAESTGWTEGAPSHAWLCHGENVINHRLRHEYPMAPEEVVAFFGGPHAWQDTYERLVALRESLARAA